MMQDVWVAHFGLSGNKEIVLYLDCLDVFLNSLLHCDSLKEFPYYRIDLKNDICFVKKAEVHYIHIKKVKRYIE